MMVFMAIVFPEIPPPPRPSEAEERCLGFLAWWALRSYCLQPEAEIPDTTWPPQDPLLEEAAKALVVEETLLGTTIGVFVTLFRGEALRGCLGSVEGREPLWKEVLRLTRAAASADLRFPPVEKCEFPDLELEITCLGAATPLPGDIALVLENLKPADHGIWLRLGERSGLLLPQVARRYGWDATELLDQVARKAGLARGTWRSPAARLLAFTAYSFRAEASSECPG